MENLIENYKVTFHLKSRIASIGFKLESSDESAINTFTSEFLDIFSQREENGNIIKNPLIYDSKVEEKVFEFINYWKKSFPSIAGLTSFFNKLKEKSLYVILFNMDLTAELSLYLSTHLEAWETDKDVKKLWNQNINLFGKTFENYTMRIAGNFRMAIGNPVRKERICRFCNKSMPYVNFNKKAHAISEALGNKNVILYDECDSCNEYFGRSIEGDIITYLKLFRTLYGIKGKGGIKKIKGKNFEAFRDDNDKIQFIFKSLEDRPKVGEEYSLKLHFDEKIINQNIYKTLCKFFLSIIDIEQLQYFEKTIKWIKNEFEIDELPLIGEAISYATFSHHPQLVYFLRKSDDHSLPYAVCQFIFTCKIFLFIIPFSNNDSKDFINDYDWQNVMKGLSHIDKFKNWSFHNFSDKRPKIFTITLNTDIETK